MIPAGGKTGSSAADELGTFKRSMLARVAFSILVTVVTIASRGEPTTALLVSFLGGFILLIMRGAMMLSLRRYATSAPVGGGTAALAAHALALGLVADIGALYFTNAIAERRGSIYESMDYVLWLSAGSALLGLASVLALISACRDVGQAAMASALVEEADGTLRFVSSSVALALVVGLLAMTNGDALAPFMLIVALVLVAVCVLGLMRLVTLIERTAEVLTRTRDITDLESIG
jgi:hypothetical protein